MTPKSPDCLKCKHFHYNDYAENTCDAYPIGIPENIFSSLENHMKSNGNDNGIFYEPKKKQ
jgi:hypothetical protein